MKQFLQASIRSRFWSLGQNPSSMKLFGAQLPNFSKVPALFSHPMNRFCTEKRCKSDASKVCQGKGDCGSHNHDHDHNHTGGCSHKNPQPQQDAYKEDPDILKLKELLNSSASKSAQQGGCCGGKQQGTCSSQESASCSSEEKAACSSKDHEKQGCCGGHHNHDAAHDHAHHNHEADHTHHHNHEADHHHHDHDHDHSCCGHDHSHDHHHHDHNTGIDLSELSKQEQKEKNFALKSGKSVNAIYTDTTISYSLGDEIKGVKARRQEDGQYVMVFTCTVCETRSTRSFTKKAYNEGVVLLRCETCNSLHLIADNLGWFNDEKSNIETIMEEKGEKITTIQNKEEINDVLSFFINKEENSEESDKKSSSETPNS